MTPELDAAQVTGSRFLSLGKVNAAILAEAREDSTGKFGRTTLEALAQVPANTQDMLADKIRDGLLSAKQVESEAWRLKRQALGQRVARAVGATRRFVVVGSATVEVTFRKREVTAADVVAALERAPHQIVACYRLSCPTEEFPDTAEIFFCPIPPADGNLENSGLRKHFANHAGGDQCNTMQDYWATELTVWIAKSEHLKASCEPCTRLSMSYVRTALLARLAHAR
jgi:hypothetical protein